MEQNPLQQNVEKYLASSFVGTLRVSFLMLHIHTVSEAILTYITSSPCILEDLWHTYEARLSTPLLYFSVSGGERWHLGNEESSLMLPLPSVQHLTSQLLALTPASLPSSSSSSMHFEVETWLEHLPAVQGCHMGGQMSRCATGLCKACPCSLCTLSREINWWLSYLQAKLDRSCGLH